MYKYTSFTEAKTIDEFDLLEKEKFKRGETPYNGESISFIVDSDEKIEETMKYARKKDIKNLEIVLNELKEHRGELVKDLGDIAGVFEAIEITCEDLYYVIRKDDGKKVCSSCVGSLEFVN